MRAFHRLPRFVLSFIRRCSPLTMIALTALSVDSLTAQRARPARSQADPRPFALWAADADAGRAKITGTRALRSRRRSPEFYVTGLPETSHVTQANWVINVCSPYLTVWEPEEMESRHFIVDTHGDTVPPDAEPSEIECEGGSTSQITMPLFPGFNYVEITTCGGYQTYWGTGPFDPDQWEIGCGERIFVSHWYDDPSKTYGASVTPASTSVTHVGSFPKSVFTQFTVTDDANTNQEVQVSIVACTGVVTGCAFTVGGGTSKIIALNNGTPQTFGLSYQVSTTGSGTIKFRAAAYGGPAFADTGVLNITATGSGGGGPISINMHDPNPGVSISRGACLSIPAGRNVSVECGDVRIVQPLPPTTTMNQTRAPALTYLSRHAIPGAMLGADVTITDSTINADTLLLIMKIPGKDTVSYRAPWNTAWDDGQARRVTLPFNAAAKSITTGIYTYDMEVWALNNGVPVYSTPLTGDTLVVVDRSTSPFGKGWWLNGLEQLHLTNLLAPTTTKLWIGADGSTRIYTRQSDTTVWIVTPTLDRPDTLRRVDSSGTTLWRRSVGNGAYVQFDNAGQHVATLNDRGHKTRFPHSAGKLDSIVLPVPSGSNAVPAYRFAYWFGRLDTIHAPKNPGVSERRIRLTWFGNVITAFTGTDGGHATFSATTSGSAAGRINSITDGPSFTWSTAGNVVTAFAHSGLGTTTLCPVEGAGICASVVLSGSASTSINGGRSDVGDTTRIWHTRYGAPRQIQDAFANSTVIDRENATFPMLVTKVVRPSGFTTRTTYTSRGLVDSSIAVSPIGTSDSAKTHYTWHSTFNRVTQIVGPTGDTRTFAYDTLGLMTYQEDGRGSSTRTDFGYDAARRLQYVEPPGHASNQRYRVAYDSYLGNVWRDTTPLGFVTETIRDSAGRAVKIITPIDSSPSSDVKARREVSYNAWSCVTSTRDKWNGGNASTYTFASISGTADNVDHLITNQCAGQDLVAVDIEQYVYGATLNPYGRAPCAGVSCTYDNAGNVTSLTTSAGTVHMTYDAANRLSKRFTVEVKDTVRKLPGAEGYTSPLASGFDFPAFGVKFPYYPTIGDTLIIPADTAVYTYDADGNLLTAYNRDARIKRSYYPNGAIKTDSLRIRTYTITGTPDNDFNTNVYGIKYEYDLAGRRTAMQVPTNLGHGCTAGHATQCTQTYHYVGHLGAVDTITTHRDHKFAAVYDDKGRLTSRTAPGGVDVTFAYDLDDRLVRRRERRNAGADTVHLDSLWYDARGKISKAVLKGTADPDQLARFAYDQHGYIAAAEFVGADTINHVFTNSNKGSITDLVKQKNLAGETCRADAYDEDGRIVGQFKYVCSDPDLFYLIDFSAAAGPIVLKSALQYEIDGDTTMTGLGYESAAWHQTDGKLRFFQRVGQDTTPETRFVFEEYRYDALGRRVLLRSRARGGCTASFCKSAVERFVWDGDQVLFEMRVPGDSVLSNAALETDTSTVNAHYGRVGYVHGGVIDAPVGLYRNGVALIPHANWRGFYEAGTDSTGAAVSTTVTWVNRVAAPFMDNPLPRADSGWAGSLINAGQDRSGLFYRRNRYYDPHAAHFTQTDPIGIWGGVNLYRYAAGDPINLNDPFGLCPPGYHPATPEEGELLLTAAQGIANTMAEAGTRYRQVGGASNYEAADCSGFVSMAGKLAGFGTPYTDTKSLPQSPLYDKVDGDPQAGDIMLRKGHMGISTGDGENRGISMGNGGAQTYRWNGGANGAPPDAHYRMCVPNK